MKVPNRFFADPRSLLFATVGEHHFAFDLRQTAGACEIDVPAIEGPSDSVRATMGSIAGEEIPVFDIRGWLGANASASSLALVLAGAESRFGIVVQSILDAVPPDQYRLLVLPPLMTRMHPDVLCGWAEWEGLGAFVVDAEALEGELLHGGVEIAL